MQATRELLGQPGWGGTLCSGGLQGAWPWQVQVGGIGVHLRCSPVGSCRGVCEQGPWRSQSCLAFETSGEERQEALGQVGML